MPETIIEQPHQPRPFQVMCKPIGPVCNLKCTYCYYLDKKEYFPDNTQFQISGEVLETFIRDYIRSQTRIMSNEIWSSWQGGEPTLLGIDFFRKAVELQKKYCPENKTISGGQPQLERGLIQSAMDGCLHVNQFSGNKKDCSVSSP